MSRHRVLVASEEPLIHDLICRALARAGYEPVAAPTAQSVDVVVADHDAASLACPGVPLVLLASGPVDLPQGAVLLPAPWHLADLVGTVERVLRSPHA